MFVGVVAEESFSSGPSHALAQQRIGEQLQDFCGQVRRVLFLRQQTGDTVGHHFVARSTTGRHNGHTGLHGLQQHQPKRLAAAVWRKHKHIRRPQ